MGAAGGGLLAGLGRVLSPLDLPRQALWNLPGKISQGDWGAALPGLLGLGATAGLAATGVGLPIAGLAGTALGGITQGIGKNQDEERFTAPEPSALTEALGVDPNSMGGMATSFGLGMAGDPMTYAAPTALRMLFRNLGTGLEGAARVRGPRFGGDPEALTQLPPLRDAHTAAMVEARLRAMREGPYSQQLLNEIKPGHRALGAGVEGTAYGAPGDPMVTRIGGGPGTAELFMDRPPRANTNQSMAPWARPENPLLAQPSRTVQIGPYLVEHVPKADILSSEVYGELGRAPNPEEMLLQSQGNVASRALEEAVMNQGLEAGDVVGNPGNYGRLPGGNWAITDPGTLYPTAEKLLLHPTPPTAAPQNPLLERLLGWLGSEQGVREEIAAGASPERLAGQGLNAQEIERLTGRALPTPESAAFEHIVPIKAEREEAWQGLINEVRRAQEMGLDPHADRMVGWWVDNLRRQGARVAEAQGMAGLPVPPVPTNLQGPWANAIGRGMAPGDLDPIHLALQEIRDRAAAAAVGTRRI